MVGTYGRIDVLCTSAGTAARFPAEDYPEDVYDRIIVLNLKGSFLMAQAVGRTMLARGSGSIINIASIGGSIAYPGSTAYNQSKGGVVQMTRSLALEWAESWSARQRDRAVAVQHAAGPANEASCHVHQRVHHGAHPDRAGRASRTRSWVRRCSSRRMPSTMVTGTILGVDGGYLAA